MTTSPAPGLALRAAAVLAAAYLTAGLLWLVGAPGARRSRLLLFLAALALAWLGAYGAVTGRGRLAELGAVGLALLGFWQAVLWVFVLPTGVVLAVVGLVLARRDAADTAATTPTADQGSDPDAGTDADGAPDAGPDDEPSGEGRPPRRNHGNH